MTIGRTARTAALIAFLSLAICAVGAELFYLHWLREIVASGNRELLQTSPEMLDRDLRSELPPGTPRSVVEKALSDHHVLFRHDPSRRVIRAEARDLKGSNPLAETCLYLWFFLDRNDSLQRIQSQVTHSRSRAPFRVE